MGIASAEHVESMALVTGHPQGGGTMTSKSQFVFLLVLASWSLTSQPRAQAPIDRPVSSGDLLGGYVPNGEWIEVTGHAWVSDKGMFFNFNQPSARFPMRVDIANVDPEHSRRLNSECRSLDQFHGGCRVTIRGQTGLLGDRQGIFARDVEITPKR
jgi:hypothetical protein